MERVGGLLTPLVLSALLAGLAPVGSTTAGDADALIQSGAARLKAGDLDGGVVLLRRASEVDPASSLARTRLGGALLLKQENRAAIETFREAIALDPGNADAFVGIAVAYLHLADYPLARAALEEAKRLDPAKGPRIDALVARIDREGGDGVDAPAARTGGP